MTLAQSTSSPAARPGRWTRFPVNALLADGRMQRLFPKLLWLVVPVAYYYVTMIPGGFNLESFIPTAAFVIMLVTAMALGGMVIAALHPPFRKDGYFDKARGLIATLLGIWAVALALECLSYYATKRVSPQNPTNIVGDRLCGGPLGICYGWLAGALSHIVYALAGALLLTAIIRFISRFAPATGPRPSFEPVPEPYALLAVIMVGLLMQFFDWVITYVR